MRMEKYSELVALISQHKRDEVDLAEVLKVVRLLEKRAHARGWKIGFAACEGEEDVK